MNTLIAQTIVAALQETGTDAHILESYSGRGMYGKTTTGVVTGCSLPKILMIMIVWVAEMGDTEREDIIDAFENDGYVTDCSLDSMGRSEIIIY